MTVGAPVVVSGIGTVSAHGVGLDPLESALRAGMPTVQSVDKADGFHPTGSAEFASVIPGDVLKSLLPPRVARRMSPASRMAVGAAMQAVEHSALDVDQLEGPRTAVSLGTAFGTSTFTQNLLQQVAETGPESASPFYFMETVASAHAGQIALALKAKGPNVTVSQREASGLLAVCRGAELIATGAADRVLAGNVDEITPYVHSGLDLFQALARADGDLAERALPFDRRRSGFLAAEGATLLMLEREDLAKARGAAIYARVNSWARGNDPSASAADWGHDAEPLAHRLTERLHQLGAPANSIDRVVSGASGARRGDAMEAATLSAAFRGQAMPEVLAPKASTGEYGGAFLAAAVLSLKGGFWGTGDCAFEADPVFGIELSHGAAMEPVQRTLVTTLAAGGAAAWLVLDRA